MQGRNRLPRYRSVADYVAATGLKKKFLAARWRVSQFQMSALANPGSDWSRVALDDEQVALIAADLNQTPEWVRRNLLSRAA